MSKHVDIRQARTGKFRLIIEDSSCPLGQLRIHGVISLRRWMGLPVGMPSLRSTARHGSDWPSMPSRSDPPSNWKSWFWESSQAASVT